MNTRLKYIVWINSIWIIFLIWDQLVTVLTPDAMRVDLIPAYVILSILTLYFLFKFFKSK